MERIIASILFILLSPLIFMILVIVKLTSAGPSIYSQKRAGKNLKPFLMLKVRTMYENAEKLKKKYSYLNEATGPVFKITDDPRFTKVGKILSHTGLDEILQLINIIKGEMSFVGPRPLPIEEAKRIPQEFFSRFSVKPGITSLWIISGAHNLTFNQWMESDLEYVRKKSVSLNMYIIIVTIFLMSQWTIEEVKKLVKRSDSVS